MGTEAKTSVDTVDLTETDAFSNVEGQTSYSVNDYTFVDGSRVVFAADTDPNVRNKIYVVNFITPDTIDPLIAQPIINLVPAVDGNVQTDNCTVVVDGDQKGETYWFDGSTWLLAQEKTAVQQAPLFDVFDKDGASFGDSSVYVGTSFKGNKLFS